MTFNFVNLKANGNSLRGDHEAYSVGKEVEEFHDISVGCSVVGRRPSINPGTYILNIFICLFTKRSTKLGVILKCK